MAMMMTGRVLLVCALCVLWCGAAVAVSAADVSVGGDGSAGEYLLLQWRTRLRTECAEEIGRMTGGRANASAVEECVRRVMESLHAVVDGRSRWKRQLSAVAAPAPVSPPAAPAAPAEGGGKENPNTVEVDKTRNNEVSLPRQNNELLVNSGQATTESQKKLPHSETDIVPPSNETSDQGQHNGERRKEEEEEEENDGESEHEEEDAEEGEKAEEREEDKEEEESEKNTKKEEGEEDEERVDDDALEGMPAGGQEKRNSTSGPEGAPNKTNTEGTQTPGDSDGSTAVSHTTSPLLLLLVACAAAAAAVVAA
ncbi:Mucin-associated surface protein (MASP) [Trypanosoma cruzi]|uniref:Mucin-associated surface protein (MASP), putative n=2 Tax=Trypanosoma cruzi TaxID=5693 RepID=Q4DA41_TRYCC|nr:mucin-associated surface protein (MASP), putative [Trypanosoma cruzi]EAN89393.1 mucin-associated surface protein (MASP), putative [Trypanosoma cruzi]KAF8292068.1 Mucin-associated surface protein (MASP), subgroup S127 [Trypanosoma cruzi]PWV08168.1 Mucin-associated surface protein (MASP) [Trypanosoma cruzi]|eukprot:XP_811244.1 mucin-associated surface protein (MASP) [Trypanosoma cruzi strain CL Brener]